MKHYLFCDLETGEEFIVGAYDFIEAKEIACEITDSIAEQYKVETILKYCGELTDDEAEASGLDEY